MWPWAQPPQVTILDVTSYSHPNFLKESSCFDYIYVPPTGPTLNQLLSSAPLLYLNCSCQSLRPMFHSICWLLLGTYLAWFLADTPLTPQNNVSLRCLWVSSLPTFFSSVSWLFLIPPFQSPPSLLIPRRWKSFRALLSASVSLQRITLYIFWPSTFRPQEHVRRLWNYDIRSVLSAFPGVRGDAQGNQYTNLKCMKSTSSPHPSNPSAL